MNNGLRSLGPVILLFVVSILVSSTSETPQHPRLVAPRTTPPLTLALSGELPPPTEIAQWKADHLEMKREREEWIENMHRSPGVDWREIELENRRAASLERFARIETGQVTNRWTELGSANLAGRTMAAAPSHDGQSLYIASNLGGFWRGASDGQDWAAIGDGLGVVPRSVLSVPPGSQPGIEPEVVFALGSVGSAGTIHATTDGGATWFVPEGVPDDNYDSRRILHDEGNPRTVYYLSRGRRWNGTGYDDGFLLLRSTDGGISFDLRYRFPAWPYCDVWMDRVSGGDIFVLAGDVLHRSTDAGLSFQAVGAIPEGNVMDVILAGSEDGAPALYATVKVSGNWKLYRSTNAGAAWTYRTDTPLWWRSMNASITDADVVYYGDVHCNRSTNGGLTFARINDWGEYYGDPENKLHADIPGIDIYWRGGQETVHINTDGGTYVSNDNGLSVQNLSLWGLGISQYYDIFTSGTDPYLIAAGSQDQGYQVSQEDDGDNYLPFEQLISGDYGHLTSHSRDLNYLYSVYPGFILMQLNEYPPPLLYFLDFPETSHLWLPPIVADPADELLFYFCGQKIWRYERIGGQFHEMFEMPHDFGSAVTGLAISPADPDTWYAATNGGGLWYSTNDGQTWAETNHGPNPHYFYGTALVASQTDPLVAYAGGSGYLSHCVWKTTDGGLNWTGMGTGLPNTLVLGLTLGGETMEDLFAATEAGPYGYNRETQQWESLAGTEAPLTTYWCVEWVPEIGSVRFGTYGRGIWDYRVPTAADVVEIETGRSTMAIHPNPAVERLSVRFALSAPGEVELALFDVTGRRLIDLARRSFGEGRHEVTAEIQGRGIGSGVYFVRLSGPDGIDVRKVQIAG